MVRDDVFSRGLHVHVTDRKRNKCMHTRCFVDCALIVASDTGTSLEQQGTVYFHSAMAALPVT
jgi:hypothetical protein